MDTGTAISIAAGMKNHYYAFAQLEEVLTQAAQAEGRTKDMQAEANVLSSTIAKLKADLEQIQKDKSVEERKAAMTAELAALDAWLAKQKADREDALADHKKSIDAQTEALNKQLLQARVQQAEQMAALDKEVADKKVSLTKDVADLEKKKADLQAFIDSVKSRF